MEKLREWLGTQTYNFRGYTYYVGRGIYVGTTNIFSDGHKIDKKIFKVQLDTGLTNCNERSIILPIFKMVYVCRDEDCVKYKGYYAISKELDDQRRKRDEVWDLAREEARKLPWEK